ncbi:MAG: hypothetical protein ACLP9K_09600 [Nitrososphaerales archaeon]
MNGTPKGPVPVRASYQELISFLRHFRHFGVPVIVGGWAVYFYNPYYGSVDIDVVGPSLRGSFDEIIEGYERSHGYEILQQNLLGTEITASKPIYSKGRKKRKVGDMEIDACAYERTSASLFHEDSSKRLPYSLCDRDDCRREVRIARDAVCYLPSKALLALFKVKARRDRSHDIRTKGATMNPARLAWLRGKAAKDGSDIIALLDPKDRGALLKDPMDYAQIGDLASEFDLTRLVTNTLQEVLKDGGALSLYGRSIDVSLLLERVADMRGAVV